MQILKIVILLAVLLTLIGYISYSQGGQKMDRNERASRLPAPMTLFGGPGIQHAVVVGVMFGRAEGAADANTLDGVCPELRTHEEPVEQGSTKGGLQ